MALQPFNFVTDGYVGRVPVNWYPAADSNRKGILFGSPGLLSVCTLTDCSEVRGLYTWGNYLYAVARRGSDSVLWRVDVGTGNPAEIGTITTSFTGPVWMVNNYTQLLIVDGVSGWVFTPATNTFAQISNPNFPGAAAATYQDTLGLIVQPNSISWWFSNPLNFTAWGANNNYAKEGDTDNILGILSDGASVILGGQKSTEFWQNTGGDNTSSNTATFKKVPGVLLKYGWASAAAGCIFDNTPAWLSHQGQMIRVSGYSPQIISTDIMGRAIHGHGNHAGMASIADVFTFSYVDQEHTFLQVTFPTGGQTWVYDAKTQLWHERSSYLAAGGWGRHRANCYALLNNKHYVGDYENGKVYEMSSAYFDDDGHVYPSIIHSQEWDGGQERLFFPAVEVRFEQGVGLVSGQGSDPMAMLESSKDGAETWQSCGWRSMGKIGERTKRCLWLRRGSDYRRQYRITITDPVQRTLLSVDWGQ